MFFDILFSLSSLQMCIQPQVTKPTKLKMKLFLFFSKNGYGTYHTQNFMWFFRNVTMWLKTLKYTCHDKFFWGLKSCTNLKKDIWKGNILPLFLYGRKNSLNLQKNWKSWCNISLLALVWPNKKKLIYFVAQTHNPKLFIGK